MNWTIFFCLQVADDSSVSLVLELLALESVHVFCSQVEEPLQESCVMPIEPIALIESVALNPLQLPPLLLRQMLNLFGRLADGTESQESLLRLCAQGRMRRSIHSVVVVGDTHAETTNAVAGCAATVLTENALIAGGVCVHSFPCCVARAGFPRELA